MKKTHSIVRGVPLALGLALVTLLSGCGGGVTNPPPPPPPPPVPPAAITARGAGVLVVHPSADSRFVVALETPIRITETGGGTADWNFARMQLFLGGKEVERFELGADFINNAGFKRIAANQNKTYSIIFRSNADDFDDIVMTLGFSDLKDGRQFTAEIGLATFENIDISIIPLSIPTHRIMRLD